MGRLGVYFEGRISKFVDGLDIDFLYKKKKAREKDDLANSLKIGIASY